MTNEKTTFMTLHEDMKALLAVEFNLFNID